MHGRNNYNYRLFISKKYVYIICTNFTRSILFLFAEKCSYFKQKGWIRNLINFVYFHCNQNTLKNDNLHLILFEVKHVNIKIWICMWKRKCRQTYIEERGRNISNETSKSDKKSQNSRITSSSFVFISAVRKKITKKK